MGRETGPSCPIASLLSKKTGPICQLLPHIVRKLAQTTQTAFLHGGKTGPNYPNCFLTWWENWPKLPRLLSYMVGKLAQTTQTAFLRGGKNGPNYPTAFPYLLVRKLAKLDMSSIDFEIFGSNKTSPHC